MIESVGEISGDVSMRDVTFQNNVGFPINRLEKKSAISAKALGTGAGTITTRRKKKSRKPGRSLPFLLNAIITALPMMRRCRRRKRTQASPKEKFRNNMAAINLLHDLQIENRLATPEEQETLSKYVGWGGLSMAFDENNAAWANEFTEN